MADVDNYDSLSNAELRAKCLQTGLTNVPVTDSIRKVLIKKLRALDDPAPAKKTNRRETIATTPASLEKSAQSLAVSGAAKESKDAEAIRRGNRRTIAATQTTLESVGVSVKEPKPAPAVKVVASKVIVAPISARRTSTREPSVPNQRQSSIVAEHPTVILESDEDDDIMLAAVAAREEKISRDFPTDPQERRSRSVSLGKTLPVITSFSGGNMPSVQEQELPRASPAKENIQLSAKSNVYVTSSTSGYDRFGASGLRNLPLITGSDPPSIQKPYTQATHKTTETAVQSPRYSSYASGTINNPSTSSSIGFRPSYTSPAVQRTVQHNYYNEFSDDSNAGANAEEETYNTPFLSTFARNLERLKAEPISIDGSSVSRRHNTRHTMYDAPIIGRRRTTNEKTTLGTSITQMWVALDRKYNMNRNLLLLFILMLLIFLYVLITPS